MAALTDSLPPACCAGRGGAARACAHAGALAHARAHAGRRRRADASRLPRRAAQHPDAQRRRQRSTLTCVARTLNTHFSWLSNESSQLRPGRRPPPSISTRRSLREPILVPLRDFEARAHVLGAIRGRCLLKALHARTDGAVLLAAPVEFSHVTLARLCADGLRQVGQDRCIAQRRRGRRKCRARGQRVACAAGPDQGAACWRRRRAHRCAPVSWRMALRGACSAESAPAQTRAASRASCVRVTRAATR